MAAACAAGAGGMFAGLQLVEGRGGFDGAGSSIILFGIGLVYALMGVFVGAGTVAPRLFGQRLLNAVNAEEIVALAGNLLLLVAIIWGGAAAVGLTARPHPLHLVSIAFGSFLLACLVGAGWSGMMAPR